ncbi:MAG: hypothetical protein H6592_00375 [Flavobacteriales bacterium]|nr:hypothetical protein [Flavobacteriales bacterium]
MRNALNDMNLRILRTSFLTGGLALLMGSASAQYAWDFGIHLGGANYLGEMGGTDQPRRDFVWDMKLSQTRWAFGGFARRKVNRLISVNTGLLYMRIQGADELSSYRPRRGRNLNFRNDMLEWYLRPEFTIFQDNDLGGRGRYRLDFRLFGYVGIAAYYSSPKGQINREGEFYALRDMRTELVDYSSIGVSVPVGIGFHFTQRRRHRFGMDIGWRTTFSDYLDDVSTTYKDPDALPDGRNGVAFQLYDQRPLVPVGVDVPAVENYGYYQGPGPSVKKENQRGDPTHNDSYLTLTLTYSYVLRGQSNFYRQRYNWMRGNKRVGRKSRAKF